MSNTKHTDLGELETRVLRILKDNNLLVTPSGYGIVDLSISRVDRATFKIDLSLADDGGTLYNSSFLFNILDYVPLNRDGGAYNSMMVPKQFASNIVYLIKNNLAQPVKRSKPTDHGGNVLFSFWDSDDKKGESDVDDFMAPLYTSDDIFNDYRRAISREDNQINPHDFIGGVYQLLDDNGNENGYFAHILDYSITECKYDVNIINPKGMYFRDGSHGPAYSQNTLEVRVHNLGYRLGYIDVRELWRQMPGEVSVEAYRVIAPSKVVSRLSGDIKETKTNMFEFIFKR